MLIEIKCRFTNKVLYSGEHETVKDAVVSAVGGGADLRDADLRGANLRGANLRGAYLRDADLRGANLRGANLRGAYLSDAYLRGANLRDAYLSGANLRDAYLSGANLRDADLRGADLRGADLRGADLRGAYLSGANLRDANLRGADLRGIKGKICDSHELLAHVAIRFDTSLIAVAAMIAGRLVGCWSEYTDAIRSIFGESVMLKLRAAWSQSKEWEVVQRMQEHDWPVVVEAAKENPDA